VSRTSRQADKKCGNLDSCSKSQSFFAGINLVQAGGNSGGLAATSAGGPGDKSQTLTTSLPDSARVSSLIHFIYQRGTGSQHYCSVATFFHPGSELFPSRIRIKEFKYFNPKNCFYALG
jgi:hypothetical protein